MRLIAAYAMACAVGLSACAPVMERADLVVVNGAEPETLDPAAITGQPEGRIANALFEGLTAFNEWGRPVPGVAERWVISDDGKTYTFTLRDTARWSNGTRVVANDFVESWKRTLHPKTASGYAYQLFPVRNAKAFHEGRIEDFREVAVRAPDARTLVVALESPTPYFLDLCAFVTLLPVHVPTVDDGGAWMRPGRLVGNGAFVLDRWRVNDRIRLRRNPHYWNCENVGMETIDVLPTSNATTAFNLYYTGGADLLLDKNLAPVSLLDELRKRPDFHAAPFLATFFVRFNTTRSPFDNALVRRAFSHAFDRERIVNRITRAGEMPARTIVPPGTGTYTGPKGPAFDPLQARRLLAEAGFPDGAGFPPVTFLYNSSELQNYIAVELKSMLREVLGVQIELRNLEWKVYLNAMDQLDFDLCRSSWVGDYNDPNTFLDCFVTGGGNNRTGWSNAAYDAAIDAAAREADPERRNTILRDAEHLLVSVEAPVAGIYHYVGAQLYDRSRLGGVEANVLDEHPFRLMFWRDR